MVIRPPPLRPPLIGNCRNTRSASDRKMRRKFIEWLRAPSEPESSYGAPDRNIGRLDDLIERGEADRGGASDPNHLLQVDHEDDGTAYPHIDHLGGRPPLLGQGQHVHRHRLQDLGEVTVQ